MEGPVGFEPTIKELQSTALPLGYDPMCKIIANKMYKINKKYEKNIQNIIFFLTNFGTLKKSIFIV